MQVIYEHPLKEHVKVLLRIESLFNDLDQILVGNADKNAGLMLLSSVIRCLERPDLKSKLTNELHQQHKRLSMFLENPSIEANKLKAMLSAIDSKLKFLREHNNIAELMPVNHPVIKKFQAEMMSHGAVALISDPVFYAWDQINDEHAFSLLNYWRGEIEPIYLVIKLALDIIRKSQEFKTVECNSHFYSQSISSDFSLIMIRLKEGVVPEFSAGRHHVALRFQSYKVMPKQVSIHDCMVHKFDISFGI